MTIPATCENYLVVVYSPMIDPEVVHRLPKKAHAFLNALLLVFFNGRTNSILAKFIAERPYSMAVRM